jgi:capsular polysaccharide biosynthesis protein
MEEEITLDLKDLLSIIKKRISIILIITFAATIASAIASYFVIKPTYQVSVSVLIGRDKNGQIDSSLTNNDVLMFQNLMKTYAKIAQSETVAEQSASKLNGKVSAAALSKSLTVTPQANTQILDISLVSSDAKTAYDMVNAVSESFIDAALKFTPGANIQLMDKPKMPTQPIKPKKALNIVLGFIIGLLGSVGVVFVLEYMDDTIKTEEEVTKYLELPVVAIIPKDEG